MVIVSEETAPKDFKCNWKKKYSRGRGFKTKKNKGIKKGKGKDVTGKSHEEQVYQENSCENH